MTTRPHLFSFGHGYSAQALARILLARGWAVTGSTRDPAKAAAMDAAGVSALLPGDDPAPALRRATHLLVSAAPTDDGDPAIAALGDGLRGVAGSLAWAGYLSTTGVYGDHGGGWVDETTPLTPATRRGRLRVMAEDQWRQLAAETGLPLHIFRLAGIYGPGRGPFAKVRAGTARQIVKPGQVFSRIHVDDIAQVLAASIDRPDPGAVYNVCDNDPAPPQDVLAHAAYLLGLPEPPREDFETAEMTPMARSFYAESKRVDNAKMLRDLGVTLHYPDYRSGLAALLAAEDAAATARSAE
ncbi:SDR family oxidoreductase [Meridianimarinicoccus sp. RP-17]|uniref:SDR family oxidoreductase n=1 Tax=Meridianimarinicoccus zhengii TaxID=2056810 RepID=UPI000DACF6DF|nr:SDR family oxidoreductase [Phycocomes zhengii]